MPWPALSSTRPTITDPGRDLFYAWLDEERNRRSGDIPSTSTTKAGGTSAPAHSQPETRELIVSREDELLHAIRGELEQLRADRVLNCPTVDQCPRLDHELNAINMAEAAVDRAVRKFGELAMNFPVTDPPEPGTVAASGYVVISPGQAFVPGAEVRYGAGFSDGYDAGMRHGSMRMET